MDNKKDELIMYQHQVSMLTQLGIHHLGAIQGAVYLLESDFKGGEVLSQEERGDMIRIIRDSADEHLKLVRDLLNARKRYYGQLDDETDA